MTVEKLKKRSWLRVGIAVVITVIVLGVAAYAVTFVETVVFSTPSDAVVTREFLDRYPDAVIRTAELIFEQDGSVVYLITAKQQGTAEEAKYDFALNKSGMDWKWCDDQTERTCRPIGR